MKRGFPGGMGGGINMNMIKQAQKMQQDMVKMQEELEEKLPLDFVKINQSCLANIKKIERFSASVGGSLKVIFKNGHTDYVSRRQLRTVKEKLGIVKKKHTDEKNISKRRDNI